MWFIKRVTRITLIMLAAAGLISYFATKYVNAGVSHGTLFAVAWSTVGLGIVLGSCIVGLTPFWKKLSGREKVIGTLDVLLAVYVDCGFLIIVVTLIIFLPPFLNHDMSDYVMLCIIVAPPIGLIVGFFGQLRLNRDDSWSRKQAQDDVSATKRAS